MPNIQNIDDPKFVNQQYRTAANLNVRIRLHQQFSTNPYGWQRWLFDQFQISPHALILELGCGAGNLWVENLDRVSSGWKIVLSDLSTGMVRQARHNLAASQNLHFANVDAQAIPFNQETFDVVVANHMLYHVPDKSKALSEIRRVLKPEGRFYASTIGSQHLQELNELLTRFDPQLASWGVRDTDAFILDNGSNQLEEWFPNTTICRYADSLAVTDTTLLTDYILSGRINLTPDQKRKLAAFVEQEFQANDGIFHITKDSGIFESRH